MFIRIIVVIGVLTTVLTVGCKPECTQQTYLEKVGPVTEKWDGATAVASSAPRMSLAPQISRLQEIRREVAALEISECALEAHEKLLDYMDGKINGFVAFLGSEDDDKVNQIFENATGDLDRWKELVEKIGQ